MITTKIESRIQAKTGSALYVEFHDRLNPLAVASWSKLYPDHPDSAEMVALMGECGMEDFEFSSIVVKHDYAPILLLPLFTTRYDLTTTLSGNALQFAGAAKLLLPKLLRPKVLGVGFVEGEWGEVGFDRDCPLPLLERAWGLALKTLEQRAKIVGAQLIAFKDFTFESGRCVPIGKLSNFYCINSMPYCQMDLPFRNLDEYLQTLDSDLRRYLLRAEKKRKDLKIIYERHPGAWLDSVYDLYLDQVKQSESSFGIHRKEYFARICQTVPGAHYVLYYLQDKLIGFELLVERKHSLIQKYIGIDRDAGREYKLFFLSWLQNIRYCLANGIPHTHVGASQEKLKTDLGAYLIPSVVLTRHVDPIMNQILKLALPELAYTSKVPVDQPSLGSMWTKDLQLN
jgi:uncharacterized protein